MKNSFKEQKSYLQIIKIEVYSYQDINILCYTKDEKEKYLYKINEK